MNDMQQIARGPNTFVACSARYHAALMAVQTIHSDDTDVEDVLRTHETARDAAIEMLTERVLSDVQRCGNTDARDGTTFQFEDDGKEYTQREALVHIFSVILD